MADPVRAVAVVDRVARVAAEIGAQRVGARRRTARRRMLDDDPLGHAVEVAGRAERVAARVDLRQVGAVARDGGVADLVDDRVARGAHEPLALVGALELRERARRRPARAHQRRVAAQLAARGRRAAAPVHAGTAARASAPRDARARAPQQARRAAAPQTSATATASTASSALLVEPDDVRARDCPPLTLPLRPSQWLPPGAITATYSPGTWLTFVYLPVVGRQPARAQLGRRREREALDGELDRPRRRRS